MEAEGRIMLLVPTWQHISELASFRHNGSTVGCNLDGKLWGKRHKSASQRGLDDGTMKISTSCIFRELPEHGTGYIPDPRLLEEIVRWLDSLDRL
jgi:hypothetical protein